MNKNKLHLISHTHTRHVQVNILHLVFFWGGCEVWAAPGSELGGGLRSAVLKTDSLLVININDY